MLEKCESARERWGGISDIIDQWLEHRQKLISKFVSLPNVEVRDIESHVEFFCTSMMDYLSSGHFEVYEKISNQ